jgi:hypothetical protein
MRVCMRVCKRACMRVYMRVCMRVYMRVCMRRVCMRVCVRVQNKTAECTSLLTVSNIGSMSAVPGVLYPKQFSSLSECTQDRLGGRFATAYNDRSPRESVWH